MQRIHIHTVQKLIDLAAYLMGSVLQDVGPRGIKRLLAHPAHHAVELIRGLRQVPPPDDHVAPADVEFALQLQEH